MERIRQLLRADEPVKWLFYGDSITHGALHTFGWRDYVELFAERVRFEMARATDVVINTAISGDNTRGLLGGFDWRVKQFEPHVAFIMIGMNDSTDTNDISLAEFEANLYELVERLGALGTMPVLQTTCPILPGAAPDREPHLPKYMDAIRDVAASRELPLIDHTAHWLEHPDSSDYWMSRDVHPNEFGHRVFARLLFGELDIDDPQSPTCQLFIP